MAHFEHARDEDRLNGGWQAIGSAWLMVLFVVALFVGFSALATRCEAWNRPHRPLAHVVVPRHEPGCGDIAPANPEACLPGPVSEIQGVAAAPTM